MARYRSRNKKRMERVCLKCGRLFESEGPANRICNRCSYHQPSVPENMLAASRGAQYQSGISLRTGMPYYVLDNQRDEDDLEDE